MRWPTSACSRRFASNVCMRLRAHFGIVYLLPTACEKHSQRGRGRAKSNLPKFFFQYANSMWPFLHGAATTWVSVVTAVDFLSFYRSNLLLWLECTCNMYPLLRCAIATSYFSARQHTLYMQSMLYSIFSSCRPVRLSVCVCHRQMDGRSHCMYAVAR